MNDKVTTTINGITYSCSVATVASGAYGANEIAMLGGLLLGICTFVYNIWHKERLAKILKCRRESDILEEAEK